MISKLENCDKLNNKTIPYSLCVFCLTLDSIRPRYFGIGFKGCYVGRIAKEEGVEKLLFDVNNLNWNIIIIMYITLDGCLLLNFKFF